MFCCDFKLVFLIVSNAVLTFPITFQFSHSFSVLISSFPNHCSVIMKLVNFYWNLFPLPAKKSCYNSKLLIILSLLFMVVNLFSIINTQVAG